jgi:hypothetical protein
MSLDCRSTSSEHRFDWGTVDFVALYHKEKRAVILDWKFGASLIDHPSFNLQLQDYACSILDRLDLDVTWEWVVEVAYIQPSARDMYALQPYAFDGLMLRNIASKIRNIREKAYAFSGEYSLGPACAFCKASKTGTCWAIRNNLSKFIRDDMDIRIEGLAPEQIAENLTLIKSVKKESERVYQMLADYMRAGNDVPGYSYNEKLNRISTSPNNRGVKIIPTTITNK